MTNGNPNFQKLKSGFALVVTLFLMVLISIIAMGLISLSSVALRNSSHNDQNALARANARMALMVALGQLQGLAGPDTRITASAEAIATVNGPRKVTGVWRSWEGSDHDSTTGFPTAPAYAEKLQSGDLEPVSTNAGRFLGWLVSDAATSQDPTNPPLLEETAGTIPLVSTGSLGTGRVSEEVHVVPTMIDNGKGGYAWWIDGENDKAQLKFNDGSPSTTADWAARMATFGTPDAGVYNLVEDATLNRSISHKTLDFLTPVAVPAATDPPPSEKYFYDLTSSSRGLLTNAATGGWKRDLSLMAEDWTQVSAANPRFFTLTPGTEAIPKADNLIYPWAEPILELRYPANNYATPPALQANRPTASASASWSTLQDYATQYRYISSSGSEQVTMPSFAGVFDINQVSEWRDKVRRYPVVARMNWIFSFSAIPEVPDSVELTDTFIACINMHPAITLWNPYNVELTVESLGLSTRQPFPIAFQFRIANRKSRTPSFNQSRGIVLSMNEILGNKVLELDFFNESGGRSITLQPGESRIFSSQNSDPVDGTSLSQLDLYPGYRTTGGFRYDKVDYDYPSGPVQFKGLGSEIYKLNQIKLSANIDGNSNDHWNYGKTGINYTLRNSDGQIASHHYQMPTTGKGQYYSQTGMSDGGRLKELYDDPEEFFAGMVTRNPATAEATLKNGVKSAATRNHGGVGMLNANPLTFYGRQDVDQLQGHYSINCFALNGPANSTPEGGIPSYVQPENHSFIGLGASESGALTGLTHLVVAELPLRPLRSLGELQHFDITSSNTRAPFVFNAIGNSHAFGDFEPDQVGITVNPAWDDARQAGAPLSLDHSYVANHLFFDDWFVSSIAPETQAWSQNETRTKDQVYEDHLSLTTALPNSFYRPHTRRSTVGDDLAATTAWRTIASELEVEGMFNVNSTSVHAWTSLLRNLRDVQMPEINYTGSGGWNVQPGSTSTDKTAISRTTVAGSSTDVGPNPEIGNYSQLDDGQIEALAEEIIEQIKLRGPFLSLSEFVNRQLVTGNTELALAGTFETAILKLSDHTSATYDIDLDPNKEILSDQRIPAGRTPISLNKFPEADAGHIAYGFPGWIRQADLLRSLAPILSVRDDTFRIRSYGEHRDPATGNVTAKAWCEAVVQRKADYVNLADDNTVLPGSSTLTADDNARFGRRFEIVSFRWLSQDEI